MPSHPDAIIPASPSSPSHLSRAPLGTPTTHLAPTKLPNIPQSPAAVSSTRRPSHCDRDDDRPRRIPNLAAMATSVLRPRDQNHTVRYIAQVDIEAWMLRRNKVGTSTNMFVVLEGTILSVYKNKSGPPRYKVNVRSEAVTVNPDRAELQIYVPTNVGNGKTRLLRLHIASRDEAYTWKYALESAVNSDITDYYTFGDTLGSGAYGDVVQAFDVRTNELRAVKIIQRGNNMKSRQHLESEIQVMKSISHQNIVKTYQIFDLKRTIYIVMEYVQGGDLFDFVAQHDNLTEAQGSQTIRSIFQAVEYLHRHNIVHRDLKPENILCANDTWPLQIKVSDFGFASFIDPSNDQDNTMRTQVGTAYFMAPEIISNKGHGPAVDSWACGVLLYTILTGRLPFPGKNTTEYFNNVVQGKPLFPGVLWKGISPDAMSLVKGLLNIDPNKRLTALGALQHRWIASPAEFDNEIRRDRSNLHSRRRRLFKARKAIIAVAMASKFKATIPQVVDKVGDSTRKVVGGIEQGAKKAADGVGEGIKKTASGVKKVGDGIGEGTKKVAEGVGEGTKKVAEGIAGGTKKVAEGIGTGVKKTVDGVEIGARKVGEGVKKTADGIETGLKKTADGIGEGLKKTADGIETGFKKTADGIGEGFKKTADGIETGLKKTGEGFKNVSIQAVDLVKRERSRDTDGERSNTFGGSQSDSTRESGRRRRMFRRRGHESRSSAVSGSDQPRQAEVPAPIFAANPLLPADYVPRELTESSVASHGDNLSDNPKHSSCEYYSAIEEHSDTEEGWTRESTLDEHNEKHLQDQDSDVTPPQQPCAIDIVMREQLALPDAAVENLHPIPAIAKEISNISCSSSCTPTCRPKLTPLDGLPIGLSDDSMGDPMDCGHDGGDTLRKAAALLLAANTVVDMETG